MASMKRLEEDLARTADPVVRGQIEALIQKRKAERARLVEKAKAVMVPVWQNAKGAAFIIIGFVLIMAIFALLIVLFSGLGK